ncbi:hypothetical protein C8R43DRAFT_1124539 [Mycena crocata]|nr:hypothetical protein C8R43DRAFT_1124539 [Mycena crocata]
MPAERHQTRQHRKARKVPPRPLPRITDPYAPPEDPEDVAETMEELRSEEANRVIQNAMVALLKQLYEKASTADAEDADIYLDAYETQKIKYEDSFGKFVPDSENAAWFARKAPRAEELRVARLAAMDATDHDDPAMALALDLGEKFEEDFGQAFSDDLNFHFERFASHAASARCLHFVHGDDVTKWAARAEQPVTFDICNPYPEGHHRRGDFDNKLRKLKALADEERTDMHRTEMSRRRRRAESLLSAELQVSIQLLPDLKRRDWWCGSTQDVGQTVSTTDWFIVNVATHKLRYNIRYPQHQPAFAILDGAFRIEPRVRLVQSLCSLFEPYRRPRIHTDKPRAFRRSVDSATQKYSTAALSMPVGIISGMLVPGCKLTLLLQIGLNCHRLITPADFEILHKRPGADFLTAGIIFDLRQFSDSPPFKTFSSYIFGILDLTRPPFFRCWEFVPKGRHSLQIDYGPPIGLATRSRSKAGNIFNYTRDSDPLLFKHRESYVTRGSKLSFEVELCLLTGTRRLEEEWDSGYTSQVEAMPYDSPKLCEVRLDTPISVRVQGRQRGYAFKFALAGTSTTLRQRRLCQSQAIRDKISNIFVPAMATDPEATPPPAIRLDGP